MQGHQHRRRVVPGSDHFAPGEAYHFRMPRAASTFELALAGPPPPGKRTRWLYESLRQAILDVRLPPGTRLPSSRSIAQDCGMSRNTVVQVFERLAAEGYVRGTPGSGTWVRSVAGKQVSGKAPGISPAPTVKQLSRTGEALSGFRFTTPASSIDTSLFPYYPGLDLFPWTTWASIAARRWRTMARDSMGNQSPLGNRALREAIADYLRLSRGIACGAERVAIVHGMQQALDLVVRLVCDPGDTAVVEDPCYPGAVAAFVAARLQLSAMEVDLEGIQIPSDSLHARIAFVTPAHQAPTGVVMSARRRVELLRWAERNDALIFEDDYDGEFRYGAWPAPALAATADPDRLVTFGSFTKTMYPSLRLGYVVLPQWLAAPFEAAYGVTSRYPEPVLQQCVFDFFVQGHYARHIARMRTLYPLRRDALVHQLQASVGAALVPQPPRGGLAMVALLRQGTGESVALAAQRQGLALIPLSRYQVHRRQPEGLLLGFANAADSKLTHAIGLLQQALTNGHTQGPV